MKKKHKEGNKKKIQNSLIVFLCYRVQSAYKPALFSAQKKLTRSQVYITAPRYGGQLAFQRRSMFLCTGSSDRPAYVLPQCDRPIVSSGTELLFEHRLCHWLRQSLQHKLFAEINWLNTFFTSGTAFLPSYILLLVYLKLAKI